jgi:hypothetical protein
MATRPAWSLNGCGAEVERLQDILSLRDQAGAIPDELVRADILGAEDRAGDGQDVAALLQRVAHGDQRAAADAGLDYQRAERQAADDPVAHREQLWDGAGANWKLAHIVTAPHDTRLFGESHWITTEWSLTTIKQPTGRRSFLYHR